MCSWFTKQTFPITQLKYKHWWVSVDEICLFGTRPRCWVDFIMQTHLQQQSSGRYAVHSKTLS